MYTEFDSIIFDIDGTLWDSTDRVAESYNKIFGREGLEMRVTGDRLKELFGKPMTEIFEKLFPGMTSEHAAWLAEECMAQENRDLEAEACPVYPGVKETLTYLAQKLPLFIVSNCQSGYIETLINGNDLQAQFTDFLCFGDTGLSKDQTILQLMAKNGLKHPVYVGDTQGDADASRLAGMPIIHCAYGFGTVADALNRIQNFEELRDLF